MGFLDRAKKVAEQAKGIAEQAKDKAEDALAEAKSRAGSKSASSSSPADARDPRWGTPYVPGMLGRPGWREQGLTDPAAVLPIEDRDRAGVPRSTKSEIVEEPYGMGRRWTAAGRSVGLFYQLYPEHRALQLTSGSRDLSLLGVSDPPVVLETVGFDAAERAELERVVTQGLERAAE